MAGWALRPISDHPFDRQTLLTHPSPPQDNEENDNEDDDDTDDEENELKTLVSRLDPKLRQKVLSAGKTDTAESDEDNDEGGKSSGWGKRKAYWAGDTADLEIGQDVQDAEDEAEAAEVRGVFLY